MRIQNKVISRPRASWDWICLLLEERRCSSKGLACRTPLKEDAGSTNPGQFSSRSPPGQPGAQRAALQEHPANALLIFWSHPQVPSPPHQEHPCQVSHWQLYVRYFFSVLTVISGGGTIMVRILQMRISLRKVSEPAQGHVTASRPLLEPVKSSSACSTILLWALDLSLQSSLDLHLSFWRCPCSG